MIGLNIASGVLLHPNILRDNCLWVLTKCRGALISGYTDKRETGAGEHLSGHSLHVWSGNQIACSRGLYSARNRQIIQQVLLD